MINYIMACSSMFSKCNCSFPNKVVVGLLLYSCCKCNCYHHRTRETSTNPLVYLNCIHMSSRTIVQSLIHNCSPRCHRQLLSWHPYVHEGNYVQYQQVPHDVEALPPGNQLLQGTKNLNKSSSSFIQHARQLVDVVTFSV